VQQDAKTSDDRATPASQSMRGSNQSGLRAYNQRLVLSLVYTHGNLAKTDIARMTGLSAQTGSVIMRELEAEDLIVKGEPIRGKVGQPSVPLSINPDGAFFIGLKVGRRSAELILINFLGEPKTTLRKSYPWPTPPQIIEFVREGIEQIIQGLPAAWRDRVAGLGIATPFQLWDWTEQAGAPREEMDLWRDCDLRAELASFSNMPVYLQNDATAACAAELVFGQHSGLTDYLYFYIGTFVGGGVVLNGSVYSGRTGNAGALGPLPVTGPDGKPVQLIDRASIMLLERMLRDFWPGSVSALEQPGPLERVRGISPTNGSASSPAAWPRQSSRRLDHRFRACHHRWRPSGRCPGKARGGDPRGSAELRCPRPARCPTILPGTVGPSRPGAGRGQPALVRQVPDRPQCPARFRLSAAVKINRNAGRPPCRRRSGRPRSSNP
jgi:hypothetical protein